MQAGFTGIVDATFLKRSQRDAFRRLAERLGVPFTILDFCAPEAILQRRVARRSAQANDASEADLAVLHGQLAALEPLEVDEQSCAVTVDSDVPLALERLLEAVRAT